MFAWRRLLRVQGRVQVCCPRACVQPAYRPKAYMTQIDTIRTHTSILHPQPASSVLNDPSNDPDVSCMRVHDDSAGADAAELREHRLLIENNHARPRLRGDGP